MTAYLALNHDEARLLEEAMQEYAVKRRAKRPKLDAQRKQELDAASERWHDMIDRLLTACVDTRDDAPVPHSIPANIPVTETQYCRLCEIQKELKTVIGVSYSTPQELLEAMLTIGGARIVNERLTFWEDWVCLERERRNK